MSSGSEVTITDTNETEQSINETLKNNFVYFGNQKVTINTKNIDYVHYIYKEQNNGN